MFSGSSGLVKGFVGYKYTTAIEEKARWGQDNPRNGTKVVIFRCFQHRQCFQDRQWEKVEVINGTAGLWSQPGRTNCPAVLKQIIPTMSFFFAFVGGVNSGCLKTTI